MHSELKEVGDGCFAYLQLPGTWGYSNSGLIRSRGRGVVVDTLYDPRLAADMVREYRRVSSGAALDTVVNTHANGDHCWGNQCFPDARIIASQAAAREMLELPPRLMFSLVQAAKLIERAGSPAQKVLSWLERRGVPRVGPLAAAAPFLARHFGAFDFGAVALTPPNETFSHELELQVGDKRLVLFEVGPAHTRGDVVVYVPEDRLVFTGDILFEQSHPVMWEGPIGNWIAACDRILALEVDTVVPGHGSLTTKHSLVELRTYLQTLEQVAREAYAAGQTPLDAAHVLRERVAPEWGEAERMVVSLETVFKDLRQETRATDPLESLAAMARLERSTALPRRGPEAVRPRCH